MIFLRNRTFFFRTGGQETGVLWKNCLKQKPEWYGSPEARRVAENVLLFQSEVGGWSKNEEMAAVLDANTTAALQKDRRNRVATVDNGATYTQLRYLALVHQAQPDRRWQSGFLRGLDYLLTAQYANGGFPQVYPSPKGYQRHITYNDDAMIGVLTLLREIGTGQGAFSFVDVGRRERCTDALRRGIGCILQTQITVRSKKTVWCAQHDSVTLQPAPARVYEKVSLSGLESVGIVRFLMDMEKPPRFGAGCNRRGSRLVSPFPVGRYPVGENAGRCGGGFGHKCPAALGTILRHRNQSADFLWARRDNQAAVGTDRAGAAHRLCLVYRPSRPTTEPRLSGVEAEAGDTVMPGLGRPGRNRARYSMGVPDSAVWARKAAISFWVILPGLPSPIERLSSATAGMISAAVPVRKHSSAV